ncbi:RES family NAD+ phosphorylase [Paraburkholderia terrae]
MLATDSLFEYIYQKVKENVAGEGDISDFEYNMLYEGGAGDIPIATIDVVLSEWFELGNEVYYDDLCRMAPEELVTSSQGHDAHFYSDTGQMERNQFEETWAQFVEGVSHTHRFFNPTARNFLDSVFEFLVVRGDELNEGCVRTVLSGEMLFRARVVDSAAEARKFWENTSTEFALAPRGRASSQRMTPAGIPAMYCALERATCLSEIRSITGDNVASVAFTPTAQLKLLDLTKLETIEAAKLTLLDDGYLRAIHLKAFIESLVRKMSKPKGRRDELSYLSTQVVFEYIRLRFGEQVDGVMMPSVQTGEVGTNVVLFPEACLIRSVSINLEDGIRGIDEDERLSANDRAAKLAVVARSMRFHRITAIETRAEDYNHFQPLFMSDIDRKRFGPRF